MLYPFLYWTSSWVTPSIPKTRSSTAYCLLSFCKPKIVIYLLHVIENRKTWHWLYIVGPNRSWVQYWKPHISIYVHNSICRKSVWAAGDEIILSWAWMTHSILSLGLMQKLSRMYWAVGFIKSRKPQPNWIQCLPYLGGNEVWCFL